MNRHALPGMGLLDRVLIAAGCALLTGCQSVELSPPVAATMEQIDEVRQKVAPPAVELPRKGTMVMSLERCIELALGGNLNIELSGMEPLIRGEDFFIEGEIFQPLVFVDGRFQDFKERTANTQIGAEIFQEETRHVSFGISKQWSLGTRADLQWAYERRLDNSEFRFLNPAFDQSGSLEITQPILQGFGVAVNRAALNQAVNEQRIAEHTFHIVLEGELLGVYRSYWQLAARALDLELQQTSLRLAREQVALTEDRLYAGRAAPLDLTTAEAAAAQQEERVIVAQAAYRKASDELLRRIRAETDPGAYRIQIIPSTEPDLEDALPPMPAADEALRLALEHRPELHIEELHVVNREIDVAVARNRRLPVLDLFGRYGFSGLGDSTSDSFDQTASGRFPDWAVGAHLEFFFLGESRHARLRQALLERQSAEARYRQIATDIIVEVRSALFDLESAMKRVVATRRTLELAREQYAGELDRLRVGRSTVFRVDQFRRDLLDAERNKLQAEIDLFVARALLDATQGTFADSILTLITESPSPTEPRTGHKAAENDSGV